MWPKEENQNQKNASIIHQWLFTAAILVIAIFIFNLPVDKNGRRESKLSLFTASAAVTCGVVWNQVPTNSPIWTPRMNFQSVAFNGKIWVIGGAVLGATPDVWSSADGITWVLEHTFTSEISQLKEFVAITFNSEIFTLGGDGAPNQVWSSPNGSSWTNETNSAWPDGRKDHTAVIYNGKIWVLGGVTPAGTILNNVWTSTTGIGNSWSQVTTVNPIWSPRFFHQSVVFNNKIWVLGGRNNTTLFNDVWWSDNGVNWHQVANAPWSARYDMVSAVIDNKIWIMGGSDASGTKNDVWSFDGTTWTPAPNAPWSARHGAASVIFNNRLWVMGGVGTAGKTNDVWYSDCLPPANAPSANPGANHNIPVGQSHAHSGASATDADGNLASYVWTITSYPGALPTLTNDTGTISGSSASISGPTFTPDVAGSYTFQLKVVDTAGLSDTKILTETAAAGATSAYGISVTNCDWSGWAWGSDVIGWAHAKGTGYGLVGTGNACVGIGAGNSCNGSNQCVVGGGGRSCADATVCANRPPPGGGGGDGGGGGCSDPTLCPTGSGLTVSQLASDTFLFCPSHQMVLGWTYTDPNNNAQASFKVAVDNNSDFSSPEVLTTQDSSSNIFVTPSGALNLGTQYFWHVAVKDSTGEWSDWSSTANFITPGSCPVVAASFNLAANPGTISISIISAGPKTSNTSQITIIPTNVSFTDPVALSANAPSIPGAIFSFDGAPAISLNSSQYSAGSAFKITVPSNTPPSDYIVSIKGDSGSIQKTKNIILHVNNTSGNEFEI